MAVTSDLQYYRVVLVMRQAGPQALLLHLYLLLHLSLHGLRHGHLLVRAPASIMPKHQLLTRQLSPHQLVAMLGVMAPSTQRRIRHRKARLQLLLVPGREIAEKAQSIPRKTLLQQLLHGRTLHRVHRFQMHPNSKIQTSQQSFVKTIVRLKVMPHYCF